MFLSLLSVNVGDNPDRPQPGQKWLSDIYRIHQRLWMAFPDNNRRTEDPFFLGPWDGPVLPEPKPKRREAGFLFRIERDGIPRILVQSVRRPDWTYAFQNAPYLLTGETKIREFEPAPKEDRAYRFRLLANVVKRKSEVSPQGKIRKTRSGLTIARRRRTEKLICPDHLPDLLPADLEGQNKILHARWDPWREWLNIAGSKSGFRIVDQLKSPLFMKEVYTYVCHPGKNREKVNQEKSIDKRFNGGLFEGRLICTDEDQLRSSLINGIGSAKAFGFGLLSLAPAD